MLLISTTYHCKKQPLVCGGQRMCHCQRLQVSKTEPACVCYKALISEYFCVSSLLINDVVNESTRPQTYKAALKIDHKRETSATASAEQARKTVKKLVLLLATTTATTTTALPPRRACVCE